MISRCCKASKDLHFIVPKLARNPGDNAAGVVAVGGLYGVAALKAGIRVAPYAKKNPP
jgi:hypothetical protein